MKNNTFEEFAKILKMSFPDSSIKDLEKVLKNYTEIDALNIDGYLKLEGFNLLMDIMGMLMN